MTFTLFVLKKFKNSTCYKTVAKWLKEKYVEFLAY